MATNQLASRAGAFSPNSTLRNRRMLAIFSKVRFLADCFGEVKDIDSASPTDINDDFLQVNYIAILEILWGLNRVKYLNRDKTALLHKKDEGEVLRLKADADELLKQVHDKCDQF
ncbi:hypothetical protein CEXT_68281 [Caerostris extrusa]|uniref:Uncharacterized protein n=1 Tax=Caerostris extrusa TaxID=172846 RepID=A0AAV4UVQ9_CAEEX|nr:hypothetical protein CEXT_68281 [Caerostris extrusa]